MSPKPASNVRPIVPQGLPIDLLPESRMALYQFLSGQGTGNVRLNVQVGKILAVKIERIYR